MDTEVELFKDIAQGKCDVNVKLADNLEKLKTEIKQAKIKFNDAKYTVEQKTLENLNLQKKIIALNDATLIQKKRVEDLTQECVKLYMMVDDTQCKQFKAQVVSSHEEANVKKYMTSMEECKMTVQLEAGARAKQLHDQSEWKTKLVALIDKQKEELEQKKKQVVEKEKELDGLYQKNLLLKKHNEARLLRLKKQVEKAEAHQHVLLKQQHTSK